MEQFRPHRLGSLFQEKQLTVFFGNRGSSTDLFRQDFPQWQFFRLKQIHSDHIFQVDATSPDYNWEGDGSFTFSRKLALCSITADCMPVFIYSEDSQSIAAIHAGWRGIANRIIPKTFEKMKEKGVDRDNSYSFFIGPHILKSSFEVDNPVRDQILASVEAAHDDKSQYFEAISLTKSLVDLRAVALKQIRLVAPYARVITHLFDTKTDPQYRSFRRDRENSGHQVSFICLD